VSRRADADALVFGDHERTAFDYDAMLVRVRAS
jgi:hypothetical protein